MNTREITKFGCDLILEVGLLYLELYIEINYVIRLVKMDGKYISKGRAKSVLNTENSQIFHLGCRETYKGEHWEPVGDVHESWGGTFCQGI